MGLEWECQYISVSSNPTYNNLALNEEVILFGANKALAAYDLQEEKVVATKVEHGGRINCLRFIKNTDEPYSHVVSSCSSGSLIIWERRGSLEYDKVKEVKVQDKCFTVCDGIQVKDGNVLISCITSESQVYVYKFQIKEDSELLLIQELSLGRGLANEVVFHSFEDKNDVIMALGMDGGSVDLFDFDFKDDKFIKVLSLTKHEDWVRCIDFVKLESGETLMASGGQDSFIAVWKFTKSKKDRSRFEFQVHQYKDYDVVFDSMILGHEGWINSVHWNANGQLLSCSQDQSVIIWDNAGDLWVEKTRLGVTGGLIPGGYSAKYVGDTIISSGFQGAVQVWRFNEGDWVLRPSITGHFRPISDMDYDPEGNYIVTTSEDQTTRIHAPWGKPNRWHEISRPQIHGHDLFACRTIREMIVSGAEEKILRAFQPTEVFYKNLEDASTVHVNHQKTVAAAFLPALGLSNQTEDNQVQKTALDSPIEFRLDEDFLRSQTLWLEVSKLYGHVYEIACIATSPADMLIASASQAAQQKFAAIILWCAKRWKNLGEFPYHKLNVTGMEFSPDGTRLLSVSRDRTWVVWRVIKDTDYSIQVIDTGALHTRALWVGSWAPDGNYFVTGARDKKLMIWKKTNDENNEKYESVLTETFPSSVSSAAVNSDNLIAVGLETGEIQLFKYEIGTSGLKNLAQLDHNEAHHDTVKRLRFNPVRKDCLASAGSDHVLKVYRTKID